jgi:glycosyltransferase involved in cell wall biosynthesis
MASRRIAIVLPSLLGGGAERVGLTLAEEFLARGYRVDVVLAEARGDLMEMVPESAHLVDMKATRLHRLVLPFARYLRSKRPDAVLVNIWPLTTLSVLAHRIARSRSRLVLCDHNTLSRAYEERGLIHRLLLGASIGLTYRLADARVGVSRGVIEDLARLGRIDVSDFDVVYNPIPVPGGDPSGDASGRSHWAHGGGKRILSVGSFKPQKNQALLIGAFAELVKSDEAVLTILGQGPLRKDLEALVGSLGLHDRVRLPGFLSDPGNLYHSADLFVLSSDYEGFGNVIVEALSCGVPVVSTDCPSGPREILADGEFGRLVACGDRRALSAAMHEALNDSHDSERLRRRAADFLPGIAADHYLRILFPDGSMPSG